MANTAVPVSRRIGRTEVGAGPELPLAVLEAFSCSRLTVLFAFAHAGVTGKETASPQSCFERGIGLQECSRDAVPHCAGLA